jgi:hypothetical protein
LIGPHLKGRALCRLRANEGIDGHDGRMAPVDVVPAICLATIVPAGIAASLDILDAAIDLRDVGDVGHVDVADVRAICRVRRHVNLTRPQREPADRWSASDAESKFRT